MVGEVRVCLNLAELQDRGVRLTPHLTHLVGEAIGLHEVRGLGRAIGNKGAAPVLAHHEPQQLKFLQGQAHGRTRQTVALRELALGRHEVSRPVLVFDLLGENIDQLII